MLVERQRRERKAPFSRYALENPEEYCVPRNEFTTNSQKVTEFAASPTIDQRKSRMSGHRNHHNIRRVALETSDSGNFYTQLVNPHSGP
ncbi:hypothetical protein E5288_WYG019715 [Bos mutus]|uniref:Uncharacterized protein n=1 Tax=Bos mutus TaxID=72004 RepID=A0A6B0S6X9_9CETA|nr:hypothetical protein [Bos mutus]